MCLVPQLYLSVYIDKNTDIVTVLLIYTINFFCNLEGIDTTLCLTHLKQLYVNFHPFLLNSHILLHQKL